MKKLVAKLASKTIEKTAYEHAVSASAWFINKQEVPEELKNVKK
ncbi:cyclic lactone autoinducer peptide [Paenibacillaceae bacterium]|nr:cyclic lactone autoinducer peptide [Paenibacillaceae bacterium]